VTGTVIALEERRKPPPEPPPHVIEVSILRYQDSRLKAYTRGIDLTSPADRDAAIIALRAVAMTLEEME
jgi:hypothetical protein